MSIHDFNPINKSNLEILDYIKNCVKNNISVSKNFAEIMLQEATNGNVSYFRELRDKVNDD